MARQRKKKGRPVSGWVVLDKPFGMGSTEAVAKVKWLFNADKAGHAGTLDPLASGMLPIALGEATKTVPYVQDGAKVYRFTVHWGEERATDDREGEVTRTSQTRPDEAAIRALLPRYTGVIMQQPPTYSAIKVDGERAYDLARSGEARELPSREIEIGRFDLLACAADSAEFEVECGKGTYVRSLARDMGRDLGCYGHVSALRRVAVDPFRAGEMVTLQALEDAAEADRAAAPQDMPPSFHKRDALMMDTGAALTCLPQLALSDDAAHRVRLGNSAIVRGRDAPVDAEEVCAHQRGRLVAIGAVEAGMFHPRRVFRT